MITLIVTLIAAAILVADYLWGRLRYQRLIVASGRRDQSWGCEVARLLNETERLREQLFATERARDAAKTLQHWAEDHWTESAKRLWALEHKRATKQKSHKRKSKS
jgi:hypothetical protein